MAGRENQTVQDNILQTVILPGVTSFQALFRGYRTRKVLSVVRGEFRSIYDEIEGENACETCVAWRGKFGRPKIRQVGSAKSGVRYEQSVDNGKEQECVDMIPTDSERERPKKETTKKHEKENDQALVHAQKNENMNTSFELEPKTFPKSETRQDESTASSAKANSDAAQLASDIENEIIQKNEATGDERESKLEPERDTAFQFLEIKDSFSDSILQPMISTEESSEGPSMRKFAPTLVQGHTDECISGSTPDKQNKHLSTAWLKSLDKDEIIKQKKELQMELLWIQQAIESRKQYIKLKG